MTDRIPVFGWSNVRRVQVLFTENVSARAGDLSVTGLGGACAFSAFAHTARTVTATWPLSAPRSAPTGCA